jgi:hypothetical protein
MLYNALQCLRTPAVLQSHHSSSRVCSHSCRGPCFVLFMVNGWPWLVTVLFPVLPFSPACSFPSPYVLPLVSVHFLDLILDFAYCSPSQTPLCVSLASFPLSRRILSTPIPVPGPFPGHVLWYLLHIVIHFIFPGVFLDLILCMHILYIFTYPFHVPWSDPDVVLQYSLCCTYKVTLSISGSFVCSLPCFAECILSAQLPYPFPVIWSIPGLILKYAAVLVGTYQFPVT